MAAEAAPSSFDSSLVIVSRTTVLGVSISFDDDSAFDAIKRSTNKFTDAENTAKPNRMNIRVKIT